jgi:hypothetical protein
MTKGKARHIGVAAALSLALTAAAVPAIAATPSSVSTASTITTTVTTPAPAVTKATLSRVSVAGTVPFGAAAISLAKYGYTETEYFATGKAKRYRGAGNASLETATVIDSNHSYKTRVLVRKPAASKFNGTLIVEWTNVTIGVDADFVFAEAGEQFLRQGYAYAVVSAQKTGIDALKGWSPARYGTLSDSVSDVDPRDNSSVDAMNHRDSLSWDIFSGVAAALKNNTVAGSPLAGLKIKAMIATGQSQSASRLTGYYNTIQPIYRLFNGFIFWDRATNALRSDVTAPGISINSEGLELYYARPFAANGANTRTWDIAGSTHGSKYAAAYVDAMFQRDRGLRGLSGTPMTFTDWIAPSCQSTPVFSTVPNGQVIAAGMNAVLAKVLHGTAMPDNVRFQRDENGDIMRDVNGQALGGLHLSALDAPTATLNAFNPASPAAFPCNVSGSRVELTKAQLVTRYGTTATYMQQVTDIDRALATRRYLLRADVDANIANAGFANIG